MNCNNDLTPTEPPISADTEKSTLTVQFLGDVYGLEDFQDTVIRTIKDAITDKDEIIIRANSLMIKFLITLPWIILAAFWITVSVYSC